MTLALLQSMFDLHVFDPMLPESEMRDFHVPFDELDGDTKTEEALRLAVSKFERVALSGASGSGKTSVARYALDPPPPTIAPIFVPVAYRTPEVAASPALFAQYLTDVIARGAVAAGKLPPKLREDILAGVTSSIELPSVARKDTLGLTVRPWILWGNVARDITRSVSGGSVPRSEHEILERANDVLGVLRSHSLNPVLVMDDTDRMIGRANADEMIPAFFGSTLRAVVDELSAGIVVAIQPYYRGREDYQHHASGLIERHIDIPPLANVAASNSVLTRRVQYAQANADATDAFTGEALTELLAVYTQRPELSVRALLACAHAALNRAHYDGEPQITATHVLAGADDAMVR